MNAPESQLHPPVAQDPQVETRHAATALFPVEGLQYLDAASATRCQNILGHGATLGIWLTPESLTAQPMRECRRNIDLRQRIMANLPAEQPDSPVQAALLDEGVLYLTRLALLMRVGPAGLSGAASGQPLDVTSIVTILYQYLPKVIAHGIVRRLSSSAGSNQGFAAALTPDDLREFKEVKFTRAELARIDSLHGRGLWPDAPPAKAAFKGKPTAVRGAATSPPTEKKHNPWPPLPDDYMAQMGPRILWLIKDLGPNLIHLLETLPDLLGASNKSTFPIKRRITHYFQQNIWRDRHGQVLTAPDFKLRYGTLSGRHMKGENDLADPHAWPPQHWWGIQKLAVNLQSAHLWLTFLVLSSRHGEVLTLKRDCLAKGDDGQWYVKGLSFKPSRKHGGTTKESPPPQVLVDALARQARLVAASERLARLLDDASELSEVAAAGSNLWASLGAGSRSDPTEKLKHASEALVRLAVSIGLDPKPGGKNIHAHRLRKTIARLAGIAIDSSQKVLMLLLGHDDVTTTLSYMQSDPVFAKEIDDVTRELRILRAEGLIEDMHAALHTPGSLSYGGHGGGGASVLSNGVQAYEEQLHREGKEWDAESARELAVLLTNNGESARLVAPHVICTLGQHEKGACSQKKGSIVVGKCQVTCENHIEEATGRRDTQRIIPILVQHAHQNLADGHWLAAENDKRQLRQELSRFEDIGAEWHSKLEVQMLLETEHG